MTLAWTTTAPALTSLSPAAGPTGTVVTITGKGLAGATAVLFGGVEAAFVVVSDTQLRTSAPVQPLPVAGRAPQGLGLTVPVVVVGPGGASNPLAFTYASVQIAVPGPCDPLVRACGGGEPGQEGTLALAPPAGGGGGPAVGHARMPNVRATVTAAWHNGTVEVTVRVLISRPRLVRRSFLVRVRIPALGETKLARVSAEGKNVRTLHLGFAGRASAVGKLVLVRVDPTERILETRRRDNAASARVEGP